jgi:two-component system, NarL family, sensor kinase
LARALHDDLGQELTALKIELDLKNELQEDKGSLAHASEVTENVLRKVRNMSYLLHPPLLDESGLIPALHWYFEGQRQRGQLRLSFEYRPVSFPRLPQELEVAVFRIIQESLTNVFRHSGSSEARIDITHQTDAVKVRVRDFGNGIPEHMLGLSAMSGVGINGMKERAKQLSGEFRISRADPGTLVEATIPIVDSGLPGTEPPHIP